MDKNNPITIEDFEHSASRAKAVASEAHKAAMVLIKEWLDQTKIAIDNLSSDPIEFTDLLDGEGALKYNTSVTGRLITPSLGTSASYRRMSEKEMEEVSTNPEEGEMSKEYEGSDQSYWIDWNDGSKMDLWESVVSANMKAVEDIRKREEAEERLREAKAAVELRKSDFKTKAANRLGTVRPQRSDAEMRSVSYGGLTLAGFSAMAAVVWVIAAYATQIPMDIWSMGAVLIGTIGSMGLLHHSSHLRQRERLIRMHCLHRLYRLQERVSDKVWDGGDDDLVAINNGPGNCQYAVIGKDFWELTKCPSGKQYNVAGGSIDDTDQYIAIRDVESLRFTCPCCDH